MTIRLFRTLTALAGLAIGVVVISGGPASAHAELLASEPPAGARLGTLPATLTLHFSEGVDLDRSAIIVVDRDSRTTPLVDVVLAPSDDTTLLATVPTSVKASGDLRVRWRSVSSHDGHVASGEYRLRPPPVVPEPTPERASASGLPRGNTAGVSGTFTAVRMLNYLSLAVLCGGLTFLALLWPSGADVARSRQVLYVAWTLGTLTTLLALGVEGATVTQKPLLAALTPGAFNSVLSTSYGRVWVCKGLLFLLAFPIIWTLSTQGSRAAKGAAWKVGAGAVSVGLLRTPGLIGHSSEGRHAAIGSVADFAHLTGIALWLGGLVLISVVVLPRRQPNELARLLPGFSLLALVAVSVVSLAGFVMSWQLVGSVHALLSTRFGHVLMIKLGLFAVLIGAAQMSKRWVSHRLDVAVHLNGDAITLRPFVASVAVEVGLALAVLTVASVLVNTRPVH